MSVEPELQGPDPLAERTITDVETLKALSDPLRLRILELMTSAPTRRSRSSASPALETRQTKLYHHVNLLAERELIRPVTTRVVSGIIETSYRIAQLQREARSRPAGRATARPCTTCSRPSSTARATTSSAASGPASSTSGEETDPLRRVILAKGLARLSPERAAEFQARLKALLDELRRRPRPDTEGTPYGFVLGFYPMTGVPVDDDAGGPERWLTPPRPRDRVARRPAPARLPPPVGGPGHLRPRRRPDDADPDAAGEPADRLDAGPGRRRDRPGHPAADDRPRGRHLRGPLGPAPDHARLGQPAGRRRARLRRHRLGRRCCRPCSVLAFVQASIGTFFTPARGALVPRVVPAEGLLAANAVTQATRVIAGVIGAGARRPHRRRARRDVAGLRPRRRDVPGVRRSSSIGVDRRAGAPTRRRPCRRRRGRRVARRRPADRRRLARLWVTLAALGMAMFGLGAINVLFLPLLVEVLGVNAAWLGAVDLAQSASMILSASLVGVLAARFRPTTIVTGGLLGARRPARPRRRSRPPGPRPRPAVPHGLARHAGPGRHRHDHADRRRRRQPRPRDGDAPGLDVRRGHRLDAVRRGLRRRCSGSGRCSCWRAGDRHRAAACSRSSSTAASSSRTRRGPALPGPSGDDVEGAPV